MYEFNWFDPNDHRPPPKKDRGLIWAPVALLLVIFVVGGGLLLLLRATGVLK